MNTAKRPFDVIGQLAALRRYARSLARNGDDAEDLVHDALVRAYENRASYKGGSSLRAWLLSILHNAHIDRLRQSKSRAVRHQQAHLDSEPQLDANQEHAVRLAQVRAAFFALPEDQREALHLVAIEDLSYQEAADTLAIPIGTLMSRVSRARERLRNFENKPPGSHLKLIGGADDDA